MRASHDAAAAALRSADAGTRSVAGASDAATVQRFVDGLEHAMYYIHANPEGAIAIAIAEKKLPTLHPAVVEPATKRVIAENVYPPEVGITLEALKVAMAAQIALDNIKARPVYSKFAVTGVIKKAFAAK